MKKEETPLFVGITGKNELRKSMLESPKGILELMKEQEKSKETRLEKARIVSTLKSEIREVTKLINALRAGIPRVNGSGGCKAEQRKVEEKPRPAKIENADRTEIEKLEDELAEIESRLNSMA